MGRREKKRKKVKSSSLLLPDTFDGDCSNQLLRNATRRSNFRVDAKIHWSAHSNLGEVLKSRISLCCILPNETY